MAIETSNQNENGTATTQGRQRKDADGFLNLVIVDKEGNPHRIKATVALYKDDRVHRALLGKAGDELALQGTVVIVDKDQPEIEL